MLEKNQTIATTEDEAVWSLTLAYPLQIQQKKLKQLLQLPLFKYCFGLEK